MTKSTKGGLFKRGGDTWWARWYAGGKCYRVSTGTTSRREAEAKLRELTAPFNLADQADTLRAIAAKAGDLKAESVALTKSAAPLAHVWQWYTGTTSRELPRASTLRQYEVQWFRFADWIKKNEPDTKTVEGVTVDIARRFVLSLRQTRTVNTANKYLRFLSLVWEVLREDDRTDAENPWAKIAAVKEVQESRRELTIEDRRRVCQAAQDDLRPLLAIGIYTGLRLGDAATLKWSEVDAVRGIIRRIPSKSQKRKPVEIAIHPVLAGMLLEVERSGEYVLPRIAADYVRHTSYVTDRLQALFNSCGITTTRKRDKGRAVVEVGFHSLRHSFVSLSRAAGAPSAVVEAIVGHSNPAMTRHYSHIGEAAIKQAVGLLPSIIAGDDAERAPVAAGADMARIRAMVEGMTAKNWKTTKAELLEVLR